MKIVVPHDVVAGESRVPLIPEDVSKLVGLGAEVVVASGLGDSICRSDDDYVKAGASVSSDHEQLISSADIVLRVNEPSMEEIGKLRKGAIHIGFLDPFSEKDLVSGLADRGVSAISMQMVPRTTRAQKMDALSSQANLAGYQAIVLGANYLNKIFPMMMTAAGTVAPARVFIIGAGVAGLQAIATAKRLGARVEAYDTRPVVEEQVRSLGGKFVKIDIGETGQIEGGYAKALTEKQLEMQRQGMKKLCANADVVVTTAQLFGRKAPVIVSAEMVAAMKPGSVVVDLAVESGGNVEGSQLGEVLDVGGVKVVGVGNLPGMVPVHSSQVYSSNLVNLVDEFWDKDEKKLKLDTSDDILCECLVTHEGKIQNEKLRERYQ